MGQCWLVHSWIRPIPAISSTSRSLSSRNGPPSSPDPLFQAVSEPIRGSLPKLGDPESSPQYLPAGRGCGDPPSPALCISAGVAGRGLPPPLPRLLPGGLGAPLRTMKPAGTARLWLPPPAPQTACFARPPKRTQLVLGRSQPCCPPGRRRGGWGARGAHGGCRCHAVDVSPRINFGHWPRSGGQGEDE